MGKNLAEPCLLQTLLIALPERSGVVNWHFESIGPMQQGSYECRAFSKMRVTDNYFVCASSTYNLIKIQPRKFLRRPQNKCEFHQNISKEKLILIAQLRFHVKFHITTLLTYSAMSVRK